MLMIIISISYSLEGKRMSKQPTVTINGVRYDVQTGMRLDLAADIEQTGTPQQTVAAPRAHNLHRRTDKTHTLNRTHVKAPASHVAAKSRRPVTHVQRSPMVRKFADITPAATTRHAAKPTQSTKDVAPIKHPVQPTVTKQSFHTAKAQPKPAHEIKRYAIEKALQSAKPAKTKRQSFFKRHPRALSISTASLALVLLAGYLTYINLPSISVRVAAVQAGIAATYPSYQPSGYSLNGPVAYSDGQVSMKFAANVGTQNFTVNQVKSTWDSSALLDNYVQPESEGDYITYNDSGLTIYVYDTNAAWVNGGILHTIQGDAPLTNDQIRHIATSM